MWDGGCDGGRGYAIHDQTLDECNAACNKLSWCTQIAFHQEDGTCYVNSKDCTKAGASGYKNYRPNNGEGPVTDNQLSRFASDLEDSFRDIVK